MTLNLFFPPSTRKSEFLFLISGIFVLIQDGFVAPAESSDFRLIEKQERHCLNPYNFLNDEIKGDTVTLNRVGMSPGDVHYLNMVLNYEDETEGFKRQNKQRSVFWPSDDLINDIQRNVISSDKQAYFIIRTRYTGLKKGALECSYYQENHILNSLIPSHMKNEFYDNNALNVNFTFPPRARDSINEGSAIETLIKYLSSELAPYGGVQVLTTFVNPTDTQTIDILKMANFLRENINPPQGTPDFYKNRDLYVWKSISDRLTYSPYFLRERIEDNDMILERSTQDDAEFIAHLYNDDEILKNQNMTRKKTIIKRKKHQSQILLLPSPEVNYYESLIFVQNNVLNSSVYLSFTVKDSITQDSLGYMQVGYLKFCPQARAQIPGAFQWEVHQLNAMKISLMMDPTERDLQTEIRAFKAFIRYIRLTRSLPERSIGDIQALTSLVYPQDVMTYKALTSCGFIDRELKKKGNQRHFLIRYI